MSTSNDIVTYRALQEHLDKLPVGFPSTESGVEIRLLKQLFTPIEARIAIELNTMPETTMHIFIRHYRSFRKLNISKKDLRLHLDSMADKGAIIGKKKGNRRYFRLVKLIIGIYEFQVERVTKEFMADLNQYMDEAYAKELCETPVNQIRVIPIEQSVPYEKFVYTYDNMKRLVKKLPGPIALAKCVCRIGHDLLGQSCKQTDLRESCLLFREPAKYWINHGFAREISKEETYKILKKAEDAGLVIQPGNMRKITFICTCCGCCCEGLKTLKKFPNPLDYYNTNYHAIVDAKLCEGCETCVGRCQMDAISIKNGISTINYNLCIGCGLCVPTCPSKALKLHKNKKKFTPPKSAYSLYLKIQKQRQGRWAKYKTILKLIFGMKLYYLLKKK